MRIYQAAKKKKKKISSSVAKKKYQHNARINRIRRREKMTSDSQVNVEIIGRHYDGRTYSVVEW